ncbi:MAG: hypothetical protein ACLQQ4_08090 [Bacteroidia bacterium]
MRTKEGKNEPMSKDINKIVNNSAMWMLVNLDKNGVHFNSSNQEEGLALIALIMGSNEEAWGILQEYVNKIKVTKQMRMN